MITIPFFTDNRLCCYLYLMRLLASLILLMCCPTFTFPFPQGRARAELDHKGATVVIEADELYRESADRWVARGDVVITYRDMKLKAPHIVYAPNTGDTLAQGPVEFTRGLQWLKGSRAELNLTSGNGIIDDAEGFTDEELFVKAKRLFKVGPDRYTAHGGFLTSCRESLPKWSFTVGKASIQQGGNARFAHTFFKIKKIPVFYLPYMAFPTAEKKRSSGLLLPSTGNSNNKGRRLTQSFYLVLGRSADVTFSEEYFSKRGYGHRTIFRTRPNPVTSLEFDWYFVDDRKNQGGTSFTGTGETKLPHGFRAVADFNLVSSFVFRQVFSDNFVTATRPTDNSRVFLTNNFRSRFFNLLFSREETVFPGPNIIIRNTPTLNFKLIGHRLFNSPVYLDLHSTAEGRSRKDRFFETPGVTQRLDFFPEVYFSVPMAEGLRLTPRLGFRETFYSDSLNQEGEAQDPLSGTNLHRRYFEATVDLKGWGLSKIYRNGSGGAWKHLVEPTLRYRYISGLDDFDRIIRFDEHDAIASANEVEFGLFNRIFVRKETDDGQTTHEWLTLKIAQKYFFDPDFGGAFHPGEVNQFFPLNTLTGFPYGGIRRNLSPVTTLLRFRPLAPYSLDLRGDYDPEFKTIRNFSITGFLSRRSFLVGTTYFVTRELEEGTFKTNQLQAYFAVGNLQKGLSGSTSFSYDVRAKRFLTHRSRINYGWDCCRISLEYQGFRIGVREEQQVRFSFFLKGIGSFGTIRRPDRLY